MSAGSSIGKISDISSNFVLSCEANDITGIAVGAVVNAWVDNSGTSNTFTKGAGSAGKYKIDSFGFPCVDFLGAGIRYQTSNSYVTLAGVTYCGVLDLTTLGGSQTFFGFLGKDEISILSGGGFMRAAGANYSPSVSSYSVGKQVVAVRRSLTDVELWVGGVLKFSTTFAAITPGGGGSAQFFMSVNDNFVGSLYSIHACSEYLDNNRFKALMRYTAFKSGLKI